MSVTKWFFLGGTLFQVVFLLFSCRQFVVLSDPKAQYPLWLRSLNFGLMLWCSFWAVWNFHKFLSP